MCVLTPCFSISGWFHKPQEGEEGYSKEDDAVDRLQSSLEQLVRLLFPVKSFLSPSSFLQSSPPAISLTSYPPDSWTAFPDIDAPGSDDDARILSDSDTTFLSHFLNPVYLSPAFLPTIAAKFSNESHVQLHSFLCESLASRLETVLREQDLADGLGPMRGDIVPSHGIAGANEWAVKGPPHKARYCVLRRASEQQEHKVQPLPDLSSASASTILHHLRTTLFTSRAFRSWLNIVASLVPIRYHVEARRFRPGLDYTLAQWDNTDARLDAVLDLTPSIEWTKKGKEKAKGVVEWESGEWGGWQCYLAQHDGDDDPAVYRSSSATKKRQKEANGESNGNHSSVVDHVPSGDEDVEDEEDDGALLTVYPGFNRFQLVLRDPAVMHFIKYVSAAAKGSRWDVCGEWEIGMLEVVDSSNSDDDGDLEEEEELDV